MGFSLLIKWISKSLKITNRVFWWGYCNFSFAYLLKRCLYIYRSIVVFRLDLETDFTKSRNRYVKSYCLRLLSSGYQNLLVGWSLAFLSLFLFLWRISYLYAYHYLRLCYYYRELAITWVSLHNMRQLIHCFALF